MFLFRPENHVTTRASVAHLFGCMMHRVQVTPLDAQVLMNFFESRIRRDFFGDCDVRYLT